MSSLTIRPIAFCGLALTLRAVAADPIPTLESLRAAHLAHAAALSSLLVEQEVTADYSAAGLDERVRERIEQRLAAQQARSEAGDGCGEASTEALLMATFHAEQVEQRMAAWQANTLQCTRQSGAYDFVGQRASVRQRDTRDLRTLSQSFGIPESQLANLDCTRTIISTAGYSLLINRDASVATVSLGSTRALTERLLLMGIVPARLFDCDYATRISRGADGAVLLQANWPNGEHLAFEVVLRPEAGQLATRITRYDRNGTKVHEFQAADFRAVAAGVAAPFFTDSFERLGQGQGARRVTRTVKRIDVNANLPAGLFAAPPTARLDAIDGPAAEAYASRTADYPN